VFRFGEPKKDESFLDGIRELLCKLSTGYAGLFIENQVRDWPSNDRVEFCRCFYIQSRTTSIKILIDRFIDHIDYFNDRFDLLNDHTYLLRCSKISIE
jgi:hypothetical protein